MNFYRVSNNGQTTWRPTVSEIQVFADQACLNGISKSYVNESGHNDGRDGSKALDNNPDTHWRPQCGTCEKNEAWLIFSTAEEAKCINAIELGKGAGDGTTWNTGIEVELQNDDCSWTTVMKSSTGNHAIFQGS